MSKFALQRIKIPGYRPVAVSEDVVQDGKIRNIKGSAILVKDDIQVQELGEKSENSIEFVGVRLIGSGDIELPEPLDLWTIYSPPSKVSEQECIKIIQPMITGNINKTLIAGDFNINLAPAKENRESRETLLKTIRKKKLKPSLKKILQDFEEEGKLKILNDYSQSTTRNSTIIDLVLTMGEWTRTGFVYPIPIDLTSTHYPLVVGVNILNNKQSRIPFNTRINYTRNKETALKLITACREARAVTHELTSHELADKILQIWKDNAKKKGKLKHEKNYKHWWNEEINQLFKAKQLHLQKHGRDAMFKELSTMLKEKIDTEKNNSFKRFASELNHKTNANVYWVMKNVGKRPPVRIDQLTIKRPDGTVVADTKKKADILSAQYQVPLGQHPVRNKDRKSLLKSKRRDNEKKYPPGTGHTPFTISEVKIAKEQLSNNKAPGASGIKKEDLALASPEIEGLVLDLGNKIASTGEWAYPLKQQIIRPIPKKDDKIHSIEEDQTRPISLLEVLDKWVQRLFYNRIQPSLSYCETQAGYIHGCDFHTSLLSDFVQNGDMKKYHIAVFTDISKAFDSVPLEELVDAIWDTKIQPAYKWAISSFIEGRSFKVQIRSNNGKLVESKSRKTLYGTPQGSVLGPMLWNILFNPLLEKLLAKKNSMSQETAALDMAFADDLTMVGASENPSNVEKHLEENLDIFKEFLDERSMKAAPHKMFAMLLDPWNKEYTPQIKFDGQLIKVVNVHKFLGILYNRKMDFEEHWKATIEAIANRTKSMLALSGASWGPTQATMLTLHTSYVESLITNGAMAWVPFLKPSWVEKLDVQLRRSIRVATGLPMNTWNAMIYLDSQTNTVEDIAIRNAVSLYARINPESDETLTLIKKHYLLKTPIWAKYLDKLPNNFWEFNIQPKLDKRILISDSVKVVIETIETSKKAHDVEQNFTKLLYTDASVDLKTDPPGQAVAAYIWYVREEDTWNVIKKESAHIGPLHSSYSAESVALIEGLKNAPSTNNCDSIGVFTDSLSNLQTISKGVAETRLEYMLFDSISDVKIPMTLHHVRSHRDNQKNQDADELCNIKIAQPDRARWHQYPGQITQETLKEWTKDWLSRRRTTKAFRDYDAIERDSASRRNLLSYMKEDDVVPKLSKDLPRNQGINVSQARSNSLTFSKVFLMKINKRSSDLCTVCLEHDDVRHILNSCIKYGPERAALLRKTNRRILRPTDMLLSKDPSIVKALGAYMGQISDKALEEEKKKRIENSLHPTPIYMNVKETIRTENWSPPQSPVYMNFVETQ